MGGRVVTTERPVKFCAVCGRRMVWRKRWRRNWDQVRHCSAACRRTGLQAVDHRLERAILALLAQRSGGSICPSEAARAVVDTHGDWRALMPAARRAARRLVVAGRVDICQGGRAVDASTAKGPIRIRRR